MNTNSLLKSFLKRWTLFALALFIVAFIALVNVFGADKLPMELEGVGIHERLGQQVDLKLTFRDETGTAVPLSKVVDGVHPVALLFAYYRCPNLCNFFLNGVTESLKKQQWTPGNEFEVLTISIDPRETPELAAKKKAAHIGALGRPEAAAGWHFWVSEKSGAADASTNSRKLADQVGWGYKYDKDQNQYAHSAAMVILTPDGRVSRYLYGIDFRPQDLRLALVEAGGRKIGSVVDRILLFCFHYDPKGRKYSLYSINLMRAGGGFTVLIFGSFLAGYWRRNRKSHVTRENG